ncbi:cytochrome c oxidase assembly protein [Sphingomonas parva]|uniref:cytochrome c oxidase assembly protein n=1 Tax=Sphingomonas parva TaxID=2555898 RepID=UPI00142FBD99|nr:cytochrome c oxidase assembly protein [Sphingomonas parva]
MALSAFAAGWRRLPRRRGGGKAVPTWRAVLFVAGIASLAFVLLPPFDHLADARFSAHMAQHLVLLVAAPPMLAASQGYVVMLHALPLRARRRAGRFIAALPGVKALARHGSEVWFVCLSSIAVLWFWHLPSSYEWARRDPLVHDAEHLLFLLAELSFWRVILTSGGRRLSRAGAAVILALMGFQGGLLAALITLASTPLYRSYGTDAVSISDQSLGGVMMWVVAGTVYLGAFALMLGLALARERRRGREALLMPEAG